MEKGKRAIVTLVLTEMPKWKPKRTGIDILGRMSSDADAKHKSVLVEGVTTIQEAEEKALQFLKDEWIAGRVSRVELLK